MSGPKEKIRDGYLVADFGAQERVIAAWRTKNGDVLRHAVTINAGSKAFDTAVRLLRDWGEMRTDVEEWLPYEQARAEFGV